MTQDNTQHMSEQEQVEAANKYNSNIHISDVKAAAEDVYQGAKSIAKNKHVQGAAIGTVAAYVAIKFLGL